MLLLAGWAGCAHGPMGPAADGGFGPGESAGETQAAPFLLRGGTLAGGAPTDLEVRDGYIAAVHQGALPEGAAALPVVDISGRWLAPGFIDSHVHLAYRPEAEALADGGVVAAVDLAAPLSFLAALPAALSVQASGPMVTAVDGYPTRSWGRDGYGWECATAAEARAAVTALAEAGATVVKLPITDAPVLDEEALRAAVEEAHARGLPVVSHALYDADVARAAAVGVDVLAHTPVEPLSAATLAAWKGRAVVSTLSAFGGSAAAVENLRQLRAAGATVLYGTDFGNSLVAGIDAREIELLGAAGLDGAAILAAGTADPAARWGWSGLGRLAVGAEASLLVLDTDPVVDPSTLARPVAVYVRGLGR